MLIAAFDIGGTAIKYGILNNDGEILYNTQIATEADKGGPSVISKVISMAIQLKKEWDIKGISISSAGQVDSTLGIVVHATENIPNYTGLHISKRIQQEVGLPVKVENDVNCTALGEYWKGAAKNKNDFLCITIGTGIGGALFLDGKLYAGSSFSGGEIGHISLYPNGKSCTCGDKGCYEMYASSKALSDKIVRELHKDIDLIDFFDLVKQNDLDCIGIFHNWLDDLTTGLKSLVHTLNPEVIVIGGGISGQGDFLLKAINKSLQSKLMANHARNLQIKLAQNGNNANLLGAAKNFFTD